MRAQRRRLVAGLAAAGMTALLHPRAARGVAARTRVIVVGAGFGGASFARHLLALAPATDVLLIERRPSFFTGPFSNLVIAGLRTPQSITRQLGRIARPPRLGTLLDTVIDMDPIGMTVRTGSGATLGADRIVVAPGIALRWDLIEGLDAAVSDRMPHGWLGDGQVVTLRTRLAAVPDGGLVVIAAPANPYRCPPGPYERASLMADTLVRTGRRRAKILIADAKDDFTKRDLFRVEWDTRYPGMIEWIPRAAGGTALRVDGASGALWLRNAGEPLRPDLASVIPAQRAADLAVRADLVDDSGWCPVDPGTFESRRHPGVHVIGDASAAAPMPKSAFAANSQARVCAAAVAAHLTGRPVAAPPLLNTCYSLLADRAAISVSGVYAATNGRLTQVTESGSPLAGDASLRRLEARQARAWYEGITADSFGRR